jgi:hypothetical protein
MTPPKTEKTDRPPSPTLLLLETTLNVLFPQRPSMGLTGRPLACAAVRLGALSGSIAATGILLLHLLGLIVFPLWAALLLFVLPAALLGAAAEVALQIKPPPTTPPSGG